MGTSAKRNRPTLCFFVSMGAPNTTVCLAAYGYHVNHRPQNTISGIFHVRSSQSRSGAGTFRRR